MTDPRRWKYEIALRRRPETPEEVAERLVAETAKKIKEIFRRRLEESNYD